MRRGRLNLRTRRRLSTLLTLAGAAALFAGCHGGADRRRPEHASAKLLDSGAMAKVSRRQAADVQFAMARTLEQSGDLDGAEAAYRETLTKDSRRADAEARLAVLAEGRGDVKTADVHFTKALKLAPADPEILCDRGYSLYLQRRWADAESLLRKAIEAAPRHSRAHNNLGLVLARQGDREGALAEFTAAGCDRADAQSNLALAMAMEGRIDDARELYAAASAAKPRSNIAREGLRAADAALASARDGGGGGGVIGVAPSQALARAESATPPARIDPAVIRTSLSRGD